MRLKVVCLFFLQCAILSPLSTSATGEQGAINRIKEFYRGYITNASLSSDNSLNKEYLTKRLIEKLDRLTVATGVDPIIRAQDFDKGAIGTLDVQYLNDNWYMVSYILGKGTQYESRQQIPLKVSQIDGRYMIDYITPIWNEELYGDNLLCEDSKLLTIDTSTPLSLLNTFYDVYTLKYSSLPEELVNQLTMLRGQHLTDNALAQFDTAEKEYKLDGENGYDLLIDNFDFDCLWRSFLKIVPLGKDTYEMNYTIKDISHSLVLKVVKQGDEYRIDDITRK